MKDHYILKGGKRLRCGYTTGSCAAAAAKAAAIMLLGGKTVSSVSLMTPAGIMLDIRVTECRSSGMSAYCCVIKDGGDDPDVTDGTRIAAEVCIADSYEEENGCRAWSGTGEAGGSAAGSGSGTGADKGAGYTEEDDRSRVIITGGTGVGRVTRKGLDQPVGEYAINSTPRRMITENVTSIMEDYGFKGTLKVSISVPDGEALAARTFNPRLGIEGGISIIGTTGIVEPMSDSAILGTIRTELGMRRAEGNEMVVITIGNYSEQFIKDRLWFPGKGTVTCSNFIGDTIDMCMDYGFREALIVGHLGKLVKLGAGIMNTHSAAADGRMEVLVSCGLLAGADTRVLKRVLECVTCDAALEELENAGVLERSMDILSERMEYHLEKKSGGKILLGAAAFSNRHKLVIMTGNAKRILKEV